MLLGVIAYNVGNLLRRLVLHVAIQSWSLTSLQQRLLKTGGRLLQRARSFILQLAESHLTPTLFRQILGRTCVAAWGIMAETSIYVPGRRRCAMKSMVAVLGLVGVVGLTVAPGAAVAHPAPPPYPS